MVDIGTMRLLVVEDHPFQRALLVRLLQGLGVAAVAEAADGREALERLSGGTAFDIVISDLDMPGMDGMALIRHVGNRGLPVSLILFSALDSAVTASVEMMTRAYHVDVLGVLPKPPTVEALRELLALHVPQREPTAPGGPVVVTPAELRAALAAQRFEPWFQPKVALADGRILGAEAVVRWRHPERGLVMPAAFIPAMEHHGLIEPLTWLVLERAFAACGRWRNRGRDWTVSVNLPLGMLEDLTLAERIARLTERLQLDPGWVVFEVTEREAMAQVGPCLENFARLRIRGFGLAIDDFGTGYSSLAQLQAIPFTELKIDQGFVTGVAERPHARVMLESSLDIAVKLGLGTVAEGVETLGDWALLRALGCDAAQGYLISPALAEAELLAWALGWVPPVA